MEGIEYLLIGIVIGALATTAAVIGTGVVR